MYDAFVSYGGEDKATAFRLVELLESDGLRCWIAPRDIDVGRPFQGEIVLGIEDSKAVIVLCSADSLVSRHVNREVERADSKDKRIIPVFIEDVEPKGALSYYFGSLQRLVVADQPVDRYAADVATAVRAPGDSTSARPTGVSGDSLVALARSICEDVREVLMRSVTPETRTLIREPRPGDEVMMIDLEANRRARDSIALWSRRHNATVYLGGEDLSDPASAGDAEVIVVLDALDGTQHWLRGRNLWCTALSIFQRNAHDSGYDLSVSMVHTADGTIYFAREDTGCAYLDSMGDELACPNVGTMPLARAHVCTVARRPVHYQVLKSYLKEAIPFAGLYTFAGNPVLPELVTGNYDAIFQPDAAAVGDPQELWDWLPGGHIALRANCVIKGLDGSPLDVVGLANKSIRGTPVSAPFVAGANAALVDDVIDWLSSGASD
ncbi:MAG: TIR domain-containing protein [Pseudomonadota bacterium]